MADKELGKQLIEDIARYKQMKDMKWLVCFIYDPEELVENAKGLVTDLEALDREIKLKVIVSRK